MKRTPLPARTTPLARSRTPMQAVNQTATKKRSARRKADWRSTHNQAVRAEAFARAGHRCEFQVPCLLTATDSPTVLYHVPCSENMGLEAHHLRYPKTRKLRADDLQILCEYHHHYVEQTQYSYRAARRKAAV